jgi:hypothetical protein
VLQETVIAAPIDPVAVAPGLVVGAICLAFIVTFVRGSRAVPSAGRIGTPSLAPALRK